MENQEVIINYNNILQVNHLIRNKLNSLLGLLDIINNCHDIAENDRRKYSKAIQFLSQELYNNLDDYLKIPENNS